ncbi:MAG: anhydro-N-acetylmuramic acid kinase [Gammaproteobacteria bacterium]|nr:anhydro-N-acetylmuramic acid kinase [Gammaproteobacteria bacterium]MDP2141885.1 anhydro-N-acetylmuramic acid kinase [Gammaproteobacteria bacterium]MDP2348164.1 anhydro-N-acetylmuramic acid kinase [Gammaproteobacteria bacterium]
MPTPQYFIGLLSGTSIDGVDCILADFSGTKPSLLATHSEPIPKTLRDNILTLCADRALSLVLLGETDVALGRVFSHAVNNLLKKANLTTSDIMAIGSHGQTVKHHPAGPDAFTLQIGDPNTISQCTGITTIADFRRKDMAVGGQGAPLAPLFHQAYFHDDAVRRAVLNIGGIANISLLKHDLQNDLIGFDNGPGNVLMDSWINLKQDLPYDRAGQWAASGSPHPDLLSRLLDEPYFALPFPKSTGRELFNLDWLQRKLVGFEDVSDADVQATLLELTALSIAQSIDWTSRGIQEIAVCGGGSHNKTLLGRLSKLLPDIKVFSSAELGLSPDWVEGMAFAWMASKTWKGEAIDCRSVTGARKPCILGGIYLAENGSKPPL